MVQRSAQDPFNYTARILKDPFNWILLDFYWTCNLLILLYIIWISAHKVYSTKQEVLQYTGGNSSSSEEEEGSVMDCETVYLCYDFVGGSRKLMR